MSEISQGENASFTSARMLHASVRDASGNAATIISLQAEHGAAQQALLQLQDGTQVLVPLSLLAVREDGSYQLPFTFQGGEAHLRIPVIEEALQVGKRRVDTGRGVRLHKSVQLHEQTVDEPLLSDELVVEHVAVGRIVRDGEVPQTRYEGDTLVMPVLEEVLVVQKQLMLKEELRVTRRQQQIHAPQKVVLRSEQIDIERFE